MKHLKKCVQNVYLSTWGTSSFTKLSTAIIICNKGLRLNHYTVVKAA